MERARPFLPRLALLGVAFAVLLLALTTRVPKWLTDFDQGFYITIAYDIDRHGVFSNGPFDQTDSTVATPPPGMFFGPVYPALVYAAMQVDPRFERAVACALEAQQKRRDYRTCEVYALPIHLLHAFLLALGVVAIGNAARIIAGGWIAFWGAGGTALAGLLFEADLFSFIMTESLSFSFYSVTTALLIAGFSCGRRVFFIAAGCALAILCLTRASYLVLVPATALLILGAGFFNLATTRIGWRHAALFVAAFLLVFTPWIVRNAVSLQKIAVTEEYGSASLVERFAFNTMTLKEFTLAFGYCVPGIGPLAVNALAGDGAMSRFEWDAPGSFFAEGRARRNALTAQHQKLDPIMSGLLRDELSQNGWRHVAVAIPLAWCGAWVSGPWSLVFLPLFVAALVMTLRRRDPRLLLYAAPGLVMLALHAGLANHYPRYNLGLIGPYAVGAAWLALTLARSRESASHLRSQSRARAP